MFPSALEILNHKSQIIIIIPILKFLQATYPRAYSGQHASRVCRGPSWTFDEADPLSYNPYENGEHSLTHAIA